MSMPKNEITNDLAKAWGTYLAGLGKALNKLEKDLKEAESMAAVCTNEWCQATEHILDELSDALFSISEPRWLKGEQSRELKQLKHKLHDLYANYRQTYQQIA
jgi:small-conductance mechanosensitive channel